jgi:hypothetical protein
MITLLAIITLLIIVIIIVIQLVTCKNNITDYDIIRFNDNEYFYKFKNKHVSTLESKNKIVKQTKKNNKICIITYDDRQNLQYVIIHNKNFKVYSEKWGFDYKYLTKCEHNVYWCKIYMLLDELITNKYDYVMWCDSDTYIFNMDINLSDIVNTYNSDILVGSDNNKVYDLINAGIFIIKNTLIGRQYLMDCIKSFNKKLCSKSDGSLKGVWAATCYEQGVMNILINDKYFKHTTILSNNLIYNNNICDNKVFIMHLYASSTNQRIKCFNSKN